MRIITGVRLTDLSMYIDIDSSISPEQGAWVSVILPDNLFGSPGQVVVAYVPKHLCSDNWLGLVGEY